jgi:RNA-binding protein YhbY
VLRQLGELQSQEISEDSHIHRQCPEIIDKVAFGEYLINQINHNLKIKKILKIKIKKRNRKPASYPPGF